MHGEAEKIRPCCRNHSQGKAGLRAYYPCTGYVLSKHRSLSLLWLSAAEEFLPILKGPADPSIPSRPRSATEAQERRTRPEAGSRGLVYVWPSVDIGKCPVDRICICPRERYRSSPRLRHGGVTGRGASAAIFLISCTDPLGDPGTCLNHSRPYVLTLAQPEIG